MLRRFSHVRRGLSSAAPLPPPPPQPPRQQPIRLVILDKDGTLVDNLGHFGAWATALGRRLGKAAATASAAATPTAGSSSGRSAAGRRSAAAVASAAAADGTALQHAASVECVEESQHDRESQHAASVEAELHRRFGLALSASGSSCEVQRGFGGALATTSTVGLQLTYTPLLGYLFPTHISSLLVATGARFGRAGQWHHAAAAGDCARGGGRFG